MSDSDADGIIDGIERRTLHTDPNNATTYTQTDRRQERLRRLVTQAGTAQQIQRVQSLHAMGLPVESVPETRTLELTDATTDFDLVTTTESGFDRYTFRALDETERTDTWLSNRAELANLTDPWDPDEDDDGLTDGQEVNWVTEVAGDRIRTDESVSFQTSPALPDTDGDGYWDGWIGVYGVNRTDNVILYREHLQSNGIRGSETVPEQAGIHNVTNSSPLGGDIFGNGTQFHSNIHIGELYWDTDLTTPTSSQAVTPSSTLEVDFYANASYATINTQAWEQGIERNYALYGIDVNIIRDEVLSASQIQNRGQCRSAFIACIVPSDGFSTAELEAVRLNHRSVPSDQYLFVAHRPADDLFLGPRNTGINLFKRPTQAVFTQTMRNASVNGTSRDVRRSPYQSPLAMTAGATQMHEIGHSLNIGRADDEVRVGTLFNNFEIYSGSTIGNRDDTPEEVKGSITWSTMARTNNDLSNYPMEGRYFAFSIEELTTIRKND